MRQAHRIPPSAFLRQARRRSRWRAYSPCRGYGACPGAAIQRPKSPVRRSKHRGRMAPSPWPPLNSTLRDARIARTPWRRCDRRIAFGTDAGQRLAFRQVGRHQRARRSRRFFRIRCPLHPAAARRWMTAAPYPAPAAGDMFPEARPRPRRSRPLPSMPILIASAPISPSAALICAAHDRRRHRMHMGDALGVLHRDGGHRRLGIDAEGLRRLEVGLDAGAAGESEPAMTRRRGGLSGIAAVAACGQAQAADFFDAPTRSGAPRRARLSRPRLPPSRGSGARCPTCAPAPGPCRPAWHWRASMRGLDPRHRPAASPS